jgi:hypothetical protein
LQSDIEQAVRGGGPKDSPARIKLMSAAELKDQLDERNILQKKYPKWHLWVSTSNRPWATRLGNIPAPSPESDQWREADWAMTIEADTWPELEDELKHQTELDERLDQQNKS